MTARASDRFSVLFLTLILGVALGIAGLLGLQWWRMPTDPESVTTTAPSAAEDDILYWTCGMHPSVRSDEPGKCPICFMDLVPIRASDQGGGDGEDILARLQVSEQGRALAMIETVPVTHRRLEHEINATGRLTLDERRVTHVHSRIGGWIGEVFVEFTGLEIAAGDPLVSLYSEELVTAQEEYLLVLRGVQRLAPGASERLRESSEALLGAARLRLQRWEITQEQIDELARTGQPSEHLTIFYDPDPASPPRGVVIERLAVEGHRVNRGDRLFTVADLSTLWMQASVYEYEMAWVQEGQRVEITTRAFPGRVFEGEIAFIDPTLDPQTRSVQVRVDVHNPDGDLRPEMWVDARIRIPLDRSNEVLARLRESAQRQWAERWERSEPLEVSATQPTSQPEDHTAHVPDAAYLCPMLCEGGEADEPGQNCPVCGMVLMPRDEVIAMHPEMFPTSQPTSQPMAQPAPEGTVLAIPDVSVLRTGQREVVYVEEEPGVYVGREVITGPTGVVMIDGQRELYVPVLAGLEPGMRVVTRGNFLLDSQTTLTGGAAAAYGSALDTGERTSTLAGHQH